MPDPNIPQAPYVPTGPAPCPMPGCEDGVCYYKSDDGKAAIWYDGTAYVKDYPSAPAPSHWTHKE